MPATLNRVRAQRRLGDDGAVLTVDWTGPSPRPFQFCMLSVPGDPAFPFLPRPFSVYDQGEGGLDFLIKEVGAGTRSLARLAAGDLVQVTGPLGNGIDPAAERPAGRRPVGVAGGVGIAPFLLWLRRRAAHRLPGPPPVLVYGARSADQLWDLDLFRALDVDLRIATEDGSRGTRGLVTDLLREALAGAPVEVVTCGPEPMMHAVARLCAGRDTPCRASLETYMGCGYGVCNGCPVKVRDARYRGGFRYDRCCVDGPVFDAAAIEWS